MKRVSLIMAIVGLLATGSMAIPHSVHACGEDPVTCELNPAAWSGGVIATTTFRMCFSWKYLQCRPCYGGGQWSYFATWCNGAYAACNDQCWGCIGYFCYDKNGNYFQQ